MKKMLFVILGALGFAAGSIIADPTFILKNKSDYFLEVELKGKLTGGKLIEKEFTMQPNEDFDGLNAPAKLDIITIRWCKQFDQGTCQGTKGTRTWSFLNSPASKSEPATSKYYLKFKADDTDGDLEPQEGNVFGRTTGLKKNYSLKGNVKNLINE